MHLGRLRTTGTDPRLDHVGRRERVAEFGFLQRQISLLPLVLLGGLGVELPGLGEGKGLGRVAFVAGFRDDQRGEAVTDAEGHLVRPLQGIGQLHRSGPFVLEFFQGALRIDLQGVEHAVHAGEHADGRIVEIQVIEGELVVRHPGGHVVRAQGDGLRQADGVRGGFPGAHQQPRIAFLRHGAAGVGGAFLQQ